MDPVILFRRGIEADGEFEIAKKYFKTTGQRTECCDNLVIPRYSALPYYRELEHDLKNLGCTLINSYEQHRWVADFDYYEDLKEFTPESWDEHDFPYTNYAGPFVVKGRTNSRKFEWNKLMFAPTKRDASHIAAELNLDGLIAPQGVIYRKYVPLRTFEIGINGLPFTNEWRFFMLGQRILSYGYYWSTADDVSLGKLDTNALALVRKVAEIASQNINFYVLDIAQTEEGNWILIEVNDGSMSGLSENDPDILYFELRKGAYDLGSKL
jgi:hypothetical protein